MAVRDDSNGDRPTRVACLTCRQRHLKCDAQLPHCSRCRTQSIQCVYGGSRRGMRVDKRSQDRSRSPHRVGVGPEQSCLGTADTQLPSLRESTDAALDPSLFDPYFVPAASVEDSTNQPNAQLLGVEQNHDQVLPPHMPDHTGASSGALTSVPVVSEDSQPSAYDDLQSIETKAYYSNFHRAHPVLPPRSFLLKHLSASIPTILPKVIKFIGAHYLTTTSKARLLTEADLLVETLEDASSTQSSAFVVQAMCLLSIALHARNRQSDAMSALDRAISIALLLKMNQEVSLLQMAAGDQMMLESFRRTWWELYVVDHMLSAIHRKSNPRTASTGASARLPCEDSLFATLDSATDWIAVTDVSFASLLRRYFDSEESHTSYSSGALRVEAAYILGRVLSLSSEDHPTESPATRLGDTSRLEDCAYHDTSPAGVHNDAEERFSSVDAYLASWHHHLPDSKLELLDKSDQVDEYLFQSHMIIHFATILLHLSRSHLQAAQSGRVTCTPKITAPVPATFTPHVHGVRATKAANELSRLASLPVDAHKHTPFWICGLVLSAIVQLSATCAQGSCKCLSPHRHRIVQTLGMLRTLQRQWPMAGYTLQQVRQVVDESMSSGWMQPSGQACDLDLANEGRLLDDQMWNQDLASMLMGVT